MSRTCPFRLTSVSFFPEALRRFWTARRTPRPALEMYSRLLKLTVLESVTVSKMALACSTWEASSRPVSSIVSFPARVALNMCFLQTLRHGDPAFAVDIFVIDRIDHGTDEMNAEPSRRALLKREARVGRR